MNILSLQSWVAYGHVGNAAAMFPLQRLGAEVWGVHTVQFSNHPGYGAWTGQVFTGAAVAEVTEGIAARGVLATCDAVLSGYMGDAGVGEAILATVDRVKAANPRVIYCCDPVMGDADALYVSAEMAELIAGRAVPMADLLTPNQFELEHLTGVRCVDMGALRLAIGVLQARMVPGGRRVVLVTSVRTEDTPTGSLEMVAADRQGCARLRLPLLPLAPSGAGDAVAAIFLFHYLQTRDAVRAMEAAGSALHGVLRQTVADGTREMALIAAQDEIVNPSVRFRAQSF